jgi:hypothetical protein
MYSKIGSVATVLGGIAAWRLTMDDWLRLGLETGLGLTAVLLLSLKTQ